MAKALSAKDLDRILLEGLDKDDPMSESLFSALGGVVSDIKGGNKPSMPGSDGSDMMEANISKKIAALILSGKNEGYLKAIKMFASVVQDNTPSKGVEAELLAKPIRFVINRFISDIAKNHGGKLSSGQRKAAVDQLIGNINAAYCVAMKCESPRVTDQSKKPVDPHAVKKQQAA